MEEGFSDSKTQRDEKVTPLTDLVFSWSLRDIFDEKLYEDQVEKIPTSFNSAEQYLGSYIYPLLEETREELASSMEIMHSAPFAELTSLSEAKPYGTFIYHVDVDQWKNRYSDRGKEPYRTLPGDIIVLSDAKPESCSDLLLPGTKWAFGSVIGISEDNVEENSTSMHFKVKVSKDIEFKDGGKTMFAVFLINITTNKRIWNALHMLRNLNIINKVLSANEEVDEDCQVCYEQNCNQLGDNFVTSVSNLNNSQAEAIQSALRKINCDHKPSVELIWGPPGTGKTKTVSVLLYVLLKFNLRTLVCAPTNIAITEVASRLLKLLSELSEAESQSEYALRSYGDILLFGNKDRLKVSTDVENIYLDHRADKLTECLVPLTGWKHCLNSMINLFEDCVEEYKVNVENQLIKEKEENGENESTELEYKSFLEFMRVRFQCIVSPLRQCLVIFCTHLPRSFLGESTFREMVTLTESLNSLEKLLFQDNMVSELLEKLFLDRKLVEHSDVDMSLLLCLKNSCLFLLKRLTRSLNALKLPSAMSRPSINEFCFQRASIIFCTVSTSFKLHSVDMEPLKVLIIDEAAQLKECESVIPLQIRGMQHAILIGDECQLPATVRSNICDNAGFGRSLFERLSHLHYAKHLLNVQYRMHPSISFFPNAKFYKNQILNAQNVQRKSYERTYLPGPMFGPYSFINIVGGREELDDVQHSRRNMVEVAVVIRIVQDLFKAWTGSGKNITVGVVSPYAAQVVAIQDKIGVKYEKLDGFSVKVKSIDGFQGGEEDIIIISTVRSNTSGSIGFISSPQRTNVALTRARHSLWILGNERTLTSGESIWNTLLHDAKNRNCFFNADEDKNLAKSIVDMKKELDELDDLLNGASVLFRSARWKVTFSDNFRRSFGSLSSRMKKSVMNLLLKLSSGWRPKNRTVDSICESSPQIIKKFKVEGLYVVCTVDIAKELTYKQVLKVWDILSLEELPKLVKRLDSIFSMYNDEFINHCREKVLEGNFEIPKCWPTSCEIVRFKVNSDDRFVIDSQGRSYAENSRVNDSLLLMKFYSLSSVVVNHLLSDHGVKNFDLPFEVTDEEMEIILHDKSSFILGRSGTGKTTVLTMKLYQREQCYYIASEGYCADECNNAMELNQKVEPAACRKEGKNESLRQLFVTVSPKLCYAVKQHVSQLKSFARGGKFSEDNLIDKDGMDDAEEFKEIPDSFRDIHADSYPLVITYQKFLMMLDGTLEKSYFERFHDASQLCHDRYMGSSSFAFHAFVRMKEVNFEKFCSCYWPHFSDNLTKKLDASRVFTEIISYIKGGLQAVESCDFKLSRDEYLGIAECRVSTMSRQNREKIYDIYKDYEKMKMGRGEYDLADLVIDLHRRLRKERFEGQKMDFVYIDEVQDLTMSQISLFRYICGNVDEGFVFSGDTAQTIARGIDFRFQDIRSMFYKVFMESRSDGAVKRKEKGCLSEIFNLRQNFRTHDGVLQLAQSVIDLIYRFFPNFIDVLKPETSLIHGEAPVLIKPGNKENAIVTIFGNSGSVDKKVVGFGAEQVILVRDDSVRKDISSFVGKQALILTILECKGLEFQDVLLYNFFASSPLKNQWRVVYEYMNEQDLLDATCSTSFPSFNEAKHNLLSSELKQLYVAITRTRQRLWISENAEDLCKPMFDYWKRKCLVQVRKLDDSLAQAMQVASSSEEWRSRGKKLYFENNFEMATMCFERAGDVTWEKRAKASGLKASADRMRESNPKLASTYLREAAEIFDSIGKAESAAVCYCELGEFEKAGRIYLDKCGDHELKKAADCFNLAGCYSMAAEVYSRGHNFSECLFVCTKAKLFDVGLQYIEYWKQDNFKDNGVVRNKEIEDIEQKFLESCACSYHEVKDNKSMMKFVRAFYSIDSKRSFLKSMDCLDELMLLEEESGNFVEAAEIAKMTGDLLHEADLRGKAGQFCEASSIILWYVCCNALWMNRSKGWPLKQFQQKGELFCKAKEFAKRDSDSLYELVCAETNILSHEQSKLADLGQYLEVSQKHTSVRGEILSLRKILDAHFSTNAAKYEFEDELPGSGHSEKLISQNKVSVTSLVYFWNLWRENIVKLFENLGCLESQELCKSLSHTEFCFNYFGTRRQLSNVNTDFVVVIPDADWLRTVDERILQKSGILTKIDCQWFVYSARCYWQSELLSVGMKLLQILEALFNLKTKNGPSVFMQSMCLMHMFEVAKCLLDCKFLNQKYHNSKALLYFVDLSTKLFPKQVFPLDWRKPISDNFLALRLTDLSRQLLEEAIVRDISNKSDLTYGEIGDVVMMWLGTRRPSELYYRILKRFEGNMYWTAFIQHLHKDDEKSQEKSDTGPPSEKVSMASSFYEALEDTYRANWRGFNYISPNCFLYLMDRLLIMLSHFRGFFVTTRSSFVEWFLCQHSTALPETSLMALMAGHKPSVGHVHDFLANIAHQLLLNKFDTANWIRKSKLNYSFYYPLLVLKLFVILCLLCLQSRKYERFLLSLLDRSDITCMLPVDLLNVLQKSRKNNYMVLTVNLLSEALFKIGDPLVTVSFVESYPKNYRASICVDMAALHCREDIIRALFPKITSSPVKGEPNMSEREKHYIDGNAVGMSSTTLPLNSVVPKDQNFDGMDMKFNWAVFGALIDASGKEKSFINLMSNAGKLKVEIDSNIKVLTAVLTQFSEDTYDGEDGSVLPVANKMLDELKQLSSAFDTRDKKHHYDFSSIGELLKSLQSKRPKLETFLNQLLMCISTSDNKSDVQTSAEESSNSVKETISSSSNTVDSETPNISTNQDPKGKKGKKNHSKPKKKKGKK